jgi:hypothetical protein
MYSRTVRSQLAAGPGELILPIDLLDWCDLPGMALEWRHKKARVFSPLALNACH